MPPCEQSVQMRASAWLPTSNCSLGLGLFASYVLPQLGLDGPSPVVQLQLGACPPLR